MALKAGLRFFHRTGGVLLLAMVLAAFNRPAQVVVPPEDRVADILQRLVLESNQGTQAPAAFPGSDLLILKDGGGTVAVRITAVDVETLLPAMTARGFQVLGSAPDLHFIEGFFPVGRLLNLPQLAGQGLLGVLPVYRPIIDGGSVTSQGDVVHEAVRVRATTPGSYDGTGIEIGVMSDSYNNLSGAAADVASGDVPASVTIVQDLGSGGSDEGRAMVQLAYDLAPGASYAFATAFLSEQSFADNIRNLAGSGPGAIQANADIIVDDVVYLSEPFFQDGTIAQAVDDVVNNDGVAYFTSAGNRESRAYESTDFNATAVIIPSLGSVTAHDFDAGAGVDTLQRITLSSGQQIRFMLQWDDPFYTASGVDTNLDIYLLRATSGTVVASATEVNTSTQAPWELLTYTNSGGTAGFDVVITLTTGPAPGRIKYVNFGSDVTINEYDTNSPTVNPHAAAVGAQAVAAAFYGDHENPESFSSHGPSTFLFDSGGTPLGSPEVRNTPDYTAVDGTNNTFFGSSDNEGDGFPNFFGTSAAAPHAAGLAALVLQANPALTPSQLYSTLSNSADDITSTGVGFDNVTGAGLLDVYEAIYPIQRTTARNTFTDGFEAGVLSNVWETNTSGPGRIQVTSSNGPISGTYHVTMDTIAAFGTGLNELILHLDLRNGSNMVLSFDQREWGDEDQAMSATFTGSENSDGVALSVDGGTTWYRLLSLTGGNSTSTYQSNNIDLSQFAATNSLTLGADVRIKFQQFDDFPITTDGFAFDNIQVSSATPTAIGLRRFAAASQGAGDAGSGRILLLTALLIPLAGATVYWRRRQ